MASIVAIRRDSSGAPRCSVTFLLDHAPAPHESIQALVRSATLALDLQCELDDLAWVGFRLDLDPPVEAEVVGPFGTTALAATVGAESARELLASIAGGGPASSGAASSGPMVRVRARRTDGLRGEWRVPLGPMLHEAMGQSPADIVHLVTADGGSVTEVFPARSTRSRDASSAKTPLLALRGDSVIPVSQLVRPQAVIAQPWVVNQTIVATPLPAVIVAADMSGPVLDGQPLMSDRVDAVKWYLPEVSLVVPAAGAEVATSPFRFDLVTAGHTDDGSPGLEATVTLTLAAGPSAASSQAWEAAGRPKWRPLPCEVQVALALPFRDEAGTTRSELLPASTVTPQGVLGEAGSTLVATFTMKDKWARLAYGALSTPGFQATAPTVQVSLVHHGWQRSSGLAIDLSTLAITKKLALRRDRDPDRALATTQMVGMAKARLEARPPVMVTKPVIERLRLARYEKITSTAVQSVTALLPCADHGQLYRQRSDADWTVLGCQEALKLGQTTYRTWQPEPVTSTDKARVFRSLTQPGRYLVVPVEHGIGRHPASALEESLGPTLMLTSTIDVDEPANIRCVLAAALEPVLNQADLDLLKAELTQRAGRDIELVTPWQAGIDPDVAWAVPHTKSRECVAIDTGFTLVLTTDIPGLLTLRALLQREGLVGSARYRLPGGDEAVSTLHLDLGAVVGPLGGPVTLTRSGDEISLHNPLTSRVAVQRVVAGGAVVASPALMLAGGGTATLTLPAGAPDPVSLDQVCEPSLESIDETRAYIEDLEIGLTFVAVGTTSALSAVAGIEITCEFLGMTAPPLTLTSSRRQGERAFVLPLTSYAADPAVRFTATAVAADGTRTSAAPVDWPVRTRGVLIPIETPT